jgi:hydroxymethylpyrimidine/phosphomethylpyrimidine kinase
MRKVAEKDIDRKGKKKVLIEGDKKKEKQVDQEYTSRKSKEEKRRRTGGQGYEGTGATLEILDPRSWILDPSGIPFRYIQ